MSQEDSSPRMSLYDHIDELRARIVKSLYVFVAGFAVAYAFADPVLSILRKPLFDALPEGNQKLYFTNIFEAFFVHLKISGYTAAVILSPFFFYQIWSFVAPGLYPKERKLVIPFFLAATLCFAGGASFAYFVLFPVGFKYFVQYGGPADAPLLTMDSYYSTCLKLILLFGLAFELPVLICLLGFLGVIDAPLLRAQRRSAIIGIAVISALFAPPDAVSMLLLGVPLYLLYEASIWVVQAIGNRRTRAQVIPVTDDKNK